MLQRCDFYFMMSSCFCVYVSGEYLLLSMLCNGSHDNQYFKKESLCHKWINFLQASYNKTPKLEEKFECSHIK